MRIHIHTRFRSTTTSLRQHDLDQVQRVDGRLLPSSQPSVMDSPSSFGI